jgi:primary-amine oxidase
MRCAYLSTDEVNNTLALGGDGLPRWINKNECIVNEEVVLWYTLGVTHVPRVEEWPVMPVSRVGFRLVPDGFFDGNPFFSP